MKTIPLLILLIPLTGHGGRVTVAVDSMHSAELTRQCLSDGRGAVVGDGVVVCKQVRKWE